jgi:hypothetical protein
MWRGHGQRSSRGLKIQDNAPAPARAGNFFAALSRFALLERVSFAALPRFALHERKFCPGHVAANDARRFQGNAPAPAREPSYDASRGPGQYKTVIFLKFRDGATAALRWPLAACPASFYEG